MVVMVVVVVVVVVVIQTIVKQTFVTHLGVKTPSVDNFGGTGGVLQTPSGWWWWWWW